MKSKKERVFESTSIRYGRSFFTLGLALMFSLPASADSMLLNGNEVFNYQEINQQRSVSGQVLDENGEPMIGVSVLVKGTKVGAITDFDGRFKIDAPAGAQELQITYMGYKSKTVKITSGNILVKMEQDNQLLDEVVVVGYGTVKKRDLTGAVSSVKNEDIVIAPTNKVMEALQGKIAGMDITKTSGEIGEDVTISGTAKKSNLPEYEEGDDTSFVGGDELKIEFSPVKVEGSTPGVLEEGIQITITMFNSEENKNVEIPVDPGTEGGDTEEPGTGEDGGGEGGEEGNEGAPTIDLPADFSYSASTGDGKPASADAWLKTPAGLKSAIVKIETTSPAFEATLEDVDMGGNLLEGVELVNNTGIDDLFTGVGLKDRSPKPGVTEYKFPVGAFFTFLDMFTGEHKFHITLTDNEDVTVSDVLTITITE